MRWSRYGIKITVNKLRARNVRSNNSFLEVHYKLSHGPTTLYDYAFDLRSFVQICWCVPTASHIKFCAQIHPELLNSLKGKIVQKHENDTHKYELIILGTNVEEHKARVAEKQGKVKLIPSLIKLCATKTCGAVKI